MSTAAGGATPSPPRFVFVDALRGLAALWVVVFHAFAGGHMAHLAPWLPSLPLRVTLHGDLPVAVFFVLSGFVIAHGIGDARVDGRYAARFVARRRLRLDPPYLASIVVMIAARSFFAPPGAAVYPTPGVVLAHVLYLQDLLRLDTLSAVYWTLCLEVQFYVVFGLLLVVADRWRAGADAWRARHVLLGVTGLVPLAWLAGLVVLPDFPGLFLWRWHTFVVGVFAAWALTGRLARAWLYLYAALLAAAPLLRQGYFGQMAALTAVVLLEVGRAGRLDRWLAWRPLMFLGAISYSLYLVHSPVTAVVSSYTLYRLTPRTAPWEAFWLVGLVAACCAAAFVFHRMFEQPSLRWSRRLALPRSPAEPNDARAVTGSRASRSR